MSILCRMFGHKWGEAFAKAYWWKCGRCGADQLAHARAQRVKPAWDWLECERV